MPGHHAQEAPSLRAGRVVQVLVRYARGRVVLCDRYIYTAFARDIARGLDPAWVRELYSFAVKPTGAFYFRVPLETAIGRLMDGRDELKYYEAGMDREFADNEEDSFRIFQGKILDEYDKMVSEFGLTVIDATRSILQQQHEMRKIITPQLKGLKRF